MHSSLLESLVTSPTLLAPSCRTHSPEGFMPTMTKALPSWRAPSMAPRTSSSGFPMTWTSATWSGSLSGAASTMSSLESSSWMLPSQSRTQLLAPCWTYPTQTSSMCGGLACISPLGRLSICNLTNTALNIKPECDCSVFFHHCQ